MESLELELELQAAVNSLTLFLKAEPQISPALSPTHLGGTLYTRVWVVNEGLESTDTGQIKRYPGIDLDYRSI